MFLLPLKSEYGESHRFFSLFVPSTLELVMLNWALTFLVIAIIAAALGFGGIAGSATGIAKILFFVFLVLFILGLIVPRLRPPA